MKETIKLISISLFFGLLGGAVMFWAVHNVSKLKGDDSKIHVVDLAKIIEDGKNRYVKEFESRGGSSGNDAAEIMTKIKTFSEKLSATLADESAKRPLFVKSAVINGESVVDMTESIAEKVR